MMHYITDIVILFFLVVSASLISFFVFALSINHSRSKNSYSYNDILIDASTQIRRLQRDWPSFKFLTCIRAFMIFLTFYTRLKSKNAIGRMDTWIVYILVLFLISYSSVGIYDVIYEFLKWLNNKGA